MSKGSRKKNLVARPLRWGVGMRALRGRIVEPEEERWGQEEKDRKHAALFFGGIYRVRTGSATFAANIQHLRAAFDHRERLRSHGVEDDRVGLKKLTTVREGIGRDVQHTHDLRLGERH